MMVCPTTVVVLELNVTATVETGVAHPVADGAAEEETLLVVVGGVEPVPVILMSAQVR